HRARELPRHDQASAFSLRQRHGKHLLADGRSPYRPQPHEGAAMTPSEQIIEFNRVWKWLEKAVKRGGNTHEKQHVLARILDGRAQLWTNREAAAVTSI